MDLDRKVEPMNVAGPRDVAAPIKTKKSKSDKKATNEKKKNQTSQTTVTLLSQMMGASLLSMLQIIYNLGAIPAAILLCFTLLSQWFLMHYFVRASYYTMGTSYRDVVSQVSGKKLGYALEICNDIFKYGALVAYVIISSKSIIAFVKNVFHYQLNGFAVKAVISWVIIFPLCLLRNLDALGKIASVSSVAILTTAVSIIGYFFAYVGKGRICDEVQPYGLRLFPNKAPMDLFLTFFLYLPTLQGCFTCHSMIPNLMQELKGPKFIRQKTINVAITINNILGFLLYASVGYFGAAMFSDSISDNIITTFAPCKQIWIDIVGLLYAFVVIIAFPLVWYPVKLSIVEMTKYQTQSRQGIRLGYFLSFIFVAASMLLAMFLESILTIFSLFQALTGFIFYFVCPIDCYIKEKRIIRDFQHNIQEMEIGTADPVSVAVVSMMATSIMNRESIAKVRAFSIKMFGQQDVTAEQANQVSAVRHRAMSVEMKDGQAIVRSGSMISRPAGEAEKRVRMTEQGPVEEQETSTQNTNKDQIVNQIQDALTEIQTEETKNHEVSADLGLENEVTIAHEDLPGFAPGEGAAGDGKIPLYRWIVGWTMNIIGLVICCEGVVMSMIEIIKMFSKKPEEAS